MNFDHVKDSGEREAFATGSQRDTQQGKGRPDLIPTMPLRRLAVHFENGAAKYGERNWEKGQPLSRYYASAQRHLWAMHEGLSDEDHASAALWNIMAFMQTKQWIEDGKLPKELDDLGIITALPWHNSQLLVYSTKSNSTISAADIRVD